MYEKTKEEFTIWIRNAVKDRTSVAYEELYYFLVACFVRADSDNSGRVCVDKFDSLVEEAALMPRKYGFAPTSASLYSSDSARKEARATQFKAIDTQNHGYITLGMWINYAVNHILGKMNSLPKDFLNGDGDSVNKAEFTTFIKKAIKKGTPEYKELYFFLLETFQTADVRRNGEVDPIAFDRMIEAAAAAPRRHGLAPKTSDLFKNDWERLSKRKELFDRIDTKGTGTISFDEWLNYALEHIAGKAAGL